MIIVYLALGANLGDRHHLLRQAREALAGSPGIRVVASSALYQSAPVGGPPAQPDYLNAVLQIATDLEAGDLLQRCQQIENRFGRQRREHWGARTLDIDLLFFGDRIIREPGLTVPHPRAHLRPFVLIPLADLAPDLPHPQLGLTVRQLLAPLAPTGGVRRLADQW